MYTAQKNSFFELQKCQLCLWSKDPHVCTCLGRPSQVAQCQHKHKNEDLDHCYDSTFLSPRHSRHNFIHSLQQMSTVKVCLHETWIWCRMTIWCRMAIWCRMYVQHNNLVSYGTTHKNRINHIFVVRHYILSELCSTAWICRRTSH
jgi:hypothetical protein